MSAVSNLVLNVKRLCPLYKILHPFNPCIKLSILRNQKRVARIKPGVQDSYSYWFKLLVLGILHNSIERVNMMIYREQKVVHPSVRQCCTRRFLARWKFEK